MVLPNATRKAIINAALSGKALSPNQLLASMYGKMGGVFGKPQGLSGTIAAKTGVTRPPEVPKPLWNGINLAKYAKVPNLKQ